MNVIEGGFINDVDLAICIFPAGTIKNAELSDRMVEYTKFYALRLNQLVKHEYTIPVYECESIDDGMNRFCNSHKNILFMSAGVRIFDMSIIFDIKKEILSNPKYMAMGHILEWKEDWYELHHQFVLVNCSNWIKCGKPSYGGWSHGTEELPVIQRSEENFHDDYTPLWIKYTGEYKQQKHTKQGWNYFNASSRNGYEIVNWNQTIRSKRTYYYPEDMSDEFLDSLKNLFDDTPRDIRNSNQRMLIRTLKNVSQQIWVLNSEHMKINFANEKYSCAAFPAAGFKFLEILHKNKLAPDGKLIIYDFNPRSIDWIKTIFYSNKSPLELIEKFLYKETFKCLGCDVFSANGTFTQNFLDSYQRTISYFGGEENFNRLIEQFRCSNVEFVQCDLFNRPETLAAHLSEECLINISNIFCTDFSNAYYGLRETENRYNNFLKTLPENSRVIGFGPRCESLT